VASVSPTAARRDGFICRCFKAVRSDSVWEKFGGRWMRHNDFFYPDRSDDMPVMKEPPNLDKFLPKNRR
jgi:hypothetical protein